MNRHFPYVLYGFSQSHQLPWLWPFYFLEGNKPLRLVRKIFISISYYYLMCVSLLVWKILIEFRYAKMFLLFIEMKSLNFVLFFD